MKLTAFVLLIIGTVGLLLNEFIFNGGSVVTLILIAVDVVGLAILAFTMWVTKK